MTVIQFGIWAKWNSDFEREFEKGKTIGLIQTSDIVNKAIRKLDGEEIE